MMNKICFLWTLLSLSIITISQGNDPAGLRAYDYSHIDHYVNQYRAEGNAGISDVVAHLVSKAVNDQEKARAIYYWISTNIHYDNSFSIYYARETFANRKGVCNGFATLFHEMCGLAGLKSTVISGYAKGSSYRFGERKPFSNHAWNAVKLYDEWYLIETTWSSCLNDYDFYFLATPEQFIFNHLPLDEHYDEQTNSWVYALNSDNQFLDHSIDFARWDRLPDVYITDMKNYPEYWTLQNFGNGYPDSFLAGNYPSNFAIDYLGKVGGQYRIEPIPFVATNTNREEYTDTPENDADEKNYTTTEEVNDTDYDYNEPVLADREIEVSFEFERFLQSQEFKEFKDKVSVESDALFHQFQNYYASGELEADFNDTVDRLNTWWNSDEVIGFKKQTKEVIKSGLNSLLQWIDEN